MAVRGRGVDGHGGRTRGAALACRAVARPGDVVAVEEPAAPWLVRHLRTARIHAVGVPCDIAGPRPEALAAALAHRPVAFVYQPRAQNPSGHTVPAGRVAELAAVLASADTAAIEDDAFGPLAAGAGASLGRHLPGRVLLVRSYCTAFGPELRSCVLGGGAALVERVRAQRAFRGPAKSCRTLRRSCSRIRPRTPAAPRAVALRRAPHGPRRGPG
ncbi:aminotransferase class I/II-fold pyridoxal phosphate-dependent enzyme [Amycolatopsis sp. FDAARGOS 1241]|uniref:aminotransferase class I/II-fold pyridoxal phosphate-dependent enzyme n=1 Tax=Amycolatopsis sp. FDAARGOS 1241 TaxID=2778070 RepID=UPI0019527665|nr:aminotransferase class I/II-fold pyridoxal phosphate-dependent enzyme [Amycolatopsis sp. FDAARGOS 1241]QRP43381.1 aminotransferase class I/II-fold pyridoxal phosphate-dependent enzyme [Amycolatopsis sp. FDAARGOS 1241]